MCYTTCKNCLAELVCVFNDATTTSNGCIKTKQNTWWLKLNIFVPITMFILPKKDYLQIFVFTDKNTIYYPTSKYQPVHFYLYNCCCIHQKQKHTQTIWKYMYNFKNTRQTHSSCCSVLFSNFDWLLLQILTKYQIQSLKMLTVCKGTLSFKFVYYYIATNYLLCRIVCLLIICGCVFWAAYTCCMTIYNSAYYTTSTRKSYPWDSAYCLH